MSILYRFRVIARFSSKVTNFNPHHLHLSPPQGVILFEFRNELWCQKTRFKGLSCSVICVILRLAVLIQYRSVTDTHTHTHTHTHRQTDRHTTTAYTALSKASCGKNSRIFPGLSNILHIQLQDFPRPNLFSPARHTCQLRYIFCF